MDGDLREHLRAHLSRMALLGVRQIPRGARTSPKDLLLQMEQEVIRCRRCPIGHTRAHAVFGSGDPNADLVFVGEAPGAEEDRQGLPFVGKAGALLTRIIEAIGLDREQVYIANILKCRPPNNRDPNPEEILNCSPYLWRQMELIRPRVICALGAFAARTLLGVDTGISRLRGEFHTVRGFQVMPTYHPAYLLRNPSAKRAVWDDMKKVRELL
ncbi:MAG: uracil-DNA glycosylase [Planctomycetota bacterium]|nr:uracil-DNA glycosylase [Planctomycetota bacterium]